ncbi:MAG: four helix bundle protein [Balneolaceae bacterium]|nr:four helix bundle protein [Balneolaceae bacterium]
MATTVYRATSNFPKHEVYGLTSQIRRCTVSIISNIAEGAGRSSSREFARFLKVANGSAYELETQLFISKNLSYMADESFEELNQSLIEVQKILYTFIKKVE